MWQTLTSLENLFNAYCAAAKGKRSKPDVARFEFNLEENIFNLQSELVTGSYQHGSYHSFYIHDPKKRLISAASIVGHACFACVTVTLEA